MDTYTTNTTTAVAGNTLHRGQTYTTTATATDTASTITISGGTAVSGTYIARGNTVSSASDRDIFSRFEPYAILHSNDSNEEIIAILKDICCLLADLYEKKRLGRDGDLGAIRAFLDSIKIETEGKRDASNSVSQ